MPRQTLASVRPYIAKAAQLCESDSRVADYTNRAIQRLLPKGLWVGTVKRYRICTNASCLTWPRQIETIEALAVDSVPRKIRNEWYEFLEAGPGVMTRDKGDGLQLIDRGQACAFDDITVGAPAYIRIYCDVPETAKYIILQGYDENGNWIRTLQGSTWIDGVKVALPTDGATPVTTTKLFSSLNPVIKDSTNGTVRLYEYSGTAIVKSLAIYEPDETLPSYRRSYIPQLDKIHSGNTTCSKVTVTVMAKLSYYPVINENDFLLLGCLPALEEMTRALKMFDAHLWPEAYACEARAVEYLDEELGDEQGDGVVVAMRVDTALFGLGQIENA